MATIKPPPVPHRQPGPPVFAGSTDSTVAAVEGDSLTPGPLGVGGSGSGTGVAGSSGSGTGVQGSSGSGNGVQAISTTGVGLYPKGTPAAYFDGDVQVSGTLRGPGSAASSATFTSIMISEHTNSKPNTWVEVRLSTQR
jgi:hypothetical protein